MTSRELRNQRREAERKARKLEYKQSRAAAASASETCGAGSLAGEPVAGPAYTPGERSSSALAPSPELLDEFSAEELAEMATIRARVHARAGISDVPVASVAPKPKPGATGPTTPEGKAISSGNSLKHGLASGRVIIPGEDPADFEALLSDLVKEHAPANETESLLVQQMAQSWWLMQRAIRIQNETFTETRVDTHKLALFLRYQTTHERAFYRALNSLQKLNRARKQAEREAQLNRARVGARHASPVSQKTGPAPEFVSQSQRQIQYENGFVSQNRSQGPQPDQFVSQNAQQLAIDTEFVSQKQHPDPSFSAADR
jgi:hypothetical protein